MRTMPSKFINKSHGVKAIFYENSPPIEMAHILMGIFISSPQYQGLHLHSWDRNKNRTWIVASRKLSDEEVGDVIAENWVTQTLLDRVPSIEDIRLRSKKPAYTFGIAADLFKYLNHRPRVLSKIQESISGNDAAFDTTKFSKALLHCSDIVPLIECIRNFDALIQRVVWCVFSIG